MDNSSAMSHRHHLDEARYYEQRQNKDACLHEESKRRKMIRWIKKRFNLQDELQRAPPAPVFPRDHPSMNKRMNWVQSTRMTAGNQFSDEAAVAVSSETSTTAKSQPRPSTPEHHAHVLIVGAGVGGLCLAQGLKKHGIPFTVFERDPSPNYRSQGYRVRIDSTGYEALKANLSANNVEVLLRAAGHYLPAVDYLNARTGKAEVDKEEYEQHQPNNRASLLSHHHIFSPDRAMLRSLLLADLDDDEVQFGMAFKRYEYLPNGRMLVTFENGKTVQGTILVGADGTTSRVRRQYIPRSITLLDTDTGAIYGKTPRTPALEALFSPNSSTIVLCDNPLMSLIVEPRGRTSVDLAEFHMGNDMCDYIGWALISRAQNFHQDPNLSARELFSLPPEEIAELSIEMTRGWDPRIHALLAQQIPDWCVLLRICSMAPDLHRWEPSSVTLLGDAVHTMAPAGIGCNTALYDAQMLVKNFCKLGVNVEAIARYEHELRAAGREGITLSFDACKKMYGLPPVQDMHVVR